MVLAGRGSTVPDDLLRGLIKRGARLEVLTQPSRLLVELARAPVGAIILTQPEKISGIKELLSALRSYYPQTACWHCESEGGNTRLLRMNEQKDTPEHEHDHDHDATVAQEEPPATERSNGSGYRDEEENHPGSDPETGSSNGFELRMAGDRQPAPPLLTQEELSMLIGPDFDPPDPGDNPQHTNDSEPSQ